LIYGREEYRHHSRALTLISHFYTPFYWQPGMQLDKSYSGLGHGSFQLFSTLMLEQGLSSIDLGSSLTNLIVVSGLILHFVQVLRKEGVDFIGISKKVWPSVSGPLIFLSSYSFVIAYARDLPKDLGYVFTHHAYYPYIAQLVIAVGLSLLFLKYHSIGKTQAIQRALQFPRQKLQIQISVTSFPNPY